MAIVTIPLIFSQAAVTHAGTNPVVPLVFGASGEVEEPNGIDPITGVYRGASCFLSIQVQQAATLAVALDAPWQTAKNEPKLHAVPMPEASKLIAQFAAPWLKDFEATSAFALVTFESAKTTAQTLDLRWQNLANVLHQVKTGWSTAQADAQVLAVPWQLLQATNLMQVVNWKTAKHEAKTLTAPWQVLTNEAVHLFAAPWQLAKTLASTGGGAFSIGGAAPVVADAPKVVPLQFCQAYPANFNQAGWGATVPLAFGLDYCAWVGSAEFFILPARFYMTVHNVFAQRLPDLAGVPIYDATLSADEGSFAWSFTANGPESLFATLARSGALPTSIKLTLDGLEWVFLVESIRRTYAFGKTGAAISGRSVTALVGDPWTREAAYNNATAQNAQQLAAAALDLSGVGLDWGITDWLVGAGAWSHSGSRLSAVQRMAEASGGYVQSHRSNPTLQVRHPYPLLAGGVPGGPWNWAGTTTDVTLAGDSVITSSKEAKDGPDIDGVYITGTNQGVIAHVKRTGTAGAKLAAMQTDPLLTHLDANTQRGLSVLGKAGAKEFVTLELPVLTGANQPGVIDVGKLVQVNESTPWRGRVRSVNVNYTRPALRQSITLERHL